MAYEIPGFTVSLRSESTALAAKQYYAVTVSSSQQGYVKLASKGKLKPVLGVLQNEPQAVGDAAEVMTFGVTKGYSDGSVRQGSIVTTTTAGAFTVATSTTYQMGFCIDAANSTSAAGVYVTVYLQPLGPSSALST